MIIRLGLGRDAISDSASIGIISSYLIFTLLLTSKFLFEDDYSNGVLEEQLILSSRSSYSSPIEEIIIAKYLAYSLVIVLSGIVFIPISVLILGLSYASYWIAILALLLVILNQALLCILISSLIPGLNSSILGSMLVFPLSIPLVIIAHLSLSDYQLLTLLLGILLFLFPVVIRLAKIAITNTGT